MKLPIELSKKSGDYDFISPVINFTGNAAVVAVGGISLAAVSSFALKALGFGSIATASATALPITAAAIGVAGAVTGVATLCYIGYAASQAIGRGL